MQHLQLILKSYGFAEIGIRVESFGNGLINGTWKVFANGKSYILQRINQQVFKSPEAIVANIDTVATYLSSHHPNYLFVSPVKTTEGSSFFFSEEEGYFRLFPFVENSVTVDVVETARQAFEAARQFGKFTWMLNGLDAESLEVTIDSFHDLSFRQKQYAFALAGGNKKRMDEVKGLISKVEGWNHITEEYEKIKRNPEFKKRVTHHDTKISNVLLNREGKGLCVIDLDTVMPGYFISDVGDMMRTYLSPTSEEEQDFSRIEIREDFFAAVVEGYCTEMKDVLTATEKAHFFYAGAFMIYMQLLRFLTDYLNDDAYYGEKYPGHNKVRAHNQAVLLEKLFEKKDLLETLSLQVQEKGSETSSSMG